MTARFFRSGSAAFLLRFGAFSLFLLSLLWLTAAMPAAARHSHVTSPAAQAHHLARVAAKEKAAWRAHLAKVRELPHAKQVALKRHDRHLKRLLAKQHAQTAVKQAQAARHALKTAQAAHHAAKQATARHVAMKQARAPRPAPRAAQAHLTASQAAHNARLAVHNAHLAQAQAAHNARLRARQNAQAQKVSAHNARLTALRARWASLHGAGRGGQSIHFWQTVAAGVPVKVITVDLNNSDVKVSGLVARRGVGTEEPFHQMIERANPNVAVTGTFFSLDNLQPIGDIVIDGSLVHFGGMGTALCITPSNQARMVTTDWGRHHDWTPYDFVCACGPRLLRRGRIVLDPAAERFRDRHMLAPNSRIAVGITPGNKIVFAMTHQAIYLGRMAKAMRALGASEAMNLDAGSSTGFYYNGATLARPGRQLTNMIVVYGRRERYERALDQLVPAVYRRLDTRGVRRQVSQLVRP